MAESISAAKNAVVAWVPSPPSLLPRGFQGDVGKISAIAKGIGASLQGPDTPLATSANDVDTTALFADRHARLSLFRGEGPRMLRAGDWRRAAEIRRAWPEPEFRGAEPRPRLGHSLQAPGY